MFSSADFFFLYQLFQKPITMSNGLDPNQLHKILQTVVEGKKLPLAIGIFWKMALKVFIALSVGAHQNNLKKKKKKKKGSSSTYQRGY